MSEFTHRIKTVFTAGGETLSGTVATAADAEDNRSITVPANTPDHPVALAVVIAALKSIYILANKDVTLETNSSSAPTDTLALKAGVPWHWSAGSGVANPFAGNITSIFLSNADPDDPAVVEIRIAKDATP